MEDLDFEYTEAQRPGFIRRNAVDFVSSLMSAVLIIGWILLAGA